MTLDSPTPETPGVAGTPRPNIVLIQADQMAAQSLGAYGDPYARTPNIDALAAGGAVFDRAYCNSPLCAPSRASMMTGRLPSEIDCVDNGDDFAASAPTFAHRLRAAGYHTALVGRMHFIGPDQHHGFEERLTTDVYPADMDMVPDWRRDPADRLAWYHEPDPVFTAGPALATVQQDFDDEVGFQALRHLNDRVRANREAGRDQPFLMVASFIHPHDPYEPPREHWERFAGIDIPAPAPPEPPDPAADPHSHRLRAMCGLDTRPPGPEEVRRARRAYYAAVSYVDDHVGRIVRRIAELGLAENTVIIVTSDHGDMLGERGLWFKMSPYERSARVPLIVTGPPGLVPHGRIARPVSLLDLAPTLVELTGVEAAAVTVGRVSEAPEHGAPAPRATVHGAPAPRASVAVPTSAVPPASALPGRSLFDPADRDVVIEYLAEGTLRPMLTIVRGNLKYTLCPGDPEQLFDLDADPDELHNLALDPDAVPDYQAARAALHGALEARYDLAGLERAVLDSQESRRLVSFALAQGRQRHWDFTPEPGQRYVRGDFWGALERGKIPAEE